MLKVITLKLFLLISAEVESKHIQQAHPPDIFPFMLKSKKFEAQI